MNWLPIATIAAAQVTIVANLATMNVSIGGMVRDFHAPATTVQSAAVAYSLVTAAFMILGGKLGALLGPKRVFQGAIALYGAAMTLVAISPSIGVLVLAEAAAGLGAAGLVPSFIALIVANYRGKQQAMAIGLLAAAPGIGGAAALLVAGSAGTAFGWRAPFWVIVAMAATALLLSLRLEAPARVMGISVDWLGALLSAAAVVSVTAGVVGFGRWGLVVAKPTAPFRVFGLSPSAILIVTGVLLGMGFLAWERRRVAQGTTPLLSPGITDSPAERAAAGALLITMILGYGLFFLVPVYMQIIQDRTSFSTALALLPHALALFTAAITVNRLTDRLTLPFISRCAFILIASGLVTVGLTIRSGWFAIRPEWRDLVIVIGLIVFGLGQGSLMTVLSNVMVSAAPRELAGEVGGLRGTVNNLGGAIGTAVVGALLVASLSTMLGNAVSASSVLSDELKSQFDLSQVAFLSDEQVRLGWGRLTSTTAEVGEAVRINAESRLWALEVTHLALAALALVGLVLCRWLPVHV